MSIPENSPDNRPLIHSIHQFPRFHLSERLEHASLLLCVLVLLLSGLPQKYRTTSWSQHLLATPSRLETIQTIHHIAAIGLIILVIYQVTNIFIKLSRRQLQGDMLVVWKDIQDFVKMIGYLLFLRKDKPKFGKFNFEQKVTYWFVVFGLIIMLISGLILWFPEITTQVFPGSVIPGAKLTHSTEAIVFALFIIIWHFYHVHIERLNLSIFTGNMNEDDLRQYHLLEFENMTGKNVEQSGGG